MTRGAALTVGPDDDQVGAELRRHVGELFPGRTAAHKRIDTEFARGRRAPRDDLVELLADPLCRVVQRPHPGRALVGVNARDAGSYGLGLLYGVLQRADRAVTEVDAHDDPAIHDGTLPGDASTGRRASEQSASNRRPVARRGGRVINRRAAPSPRPGRPFRNPP